LKKKLKKKTPEPKKKFKKKYLIIPGLLVMALILFLPSLAFGLERVTDYYKPKTSEFYRTDNREITHTDLLYTGSHVGSIKGFKTGSIPIGSTPLLRSASNSSLGYAFYKPTELRTLANSLNGNPDYVINSVTKTEISKTANPSNSETWVWARDLGRAVGATVDIESTGDKDESGLPRLRVVFNTTSSPSGVFANNDGITPSKVKAGARFTVFVTAEEYDPYQSKIRWELKLDGKTLDSASGAANRSVGSVSTVLETEGTFTLSLTVTDGIERKTVMTKEISVTKGDLSCEPSLRVEPPTQTIGVGEIASYRAFYTDDKCVEHDVTNEATWSSGDPSIGEVINP